MSIWIYALFAIGYIFIYILCTLMLMEFSMEINIKLTKIKIILIIIFTPILFLIMTGYYCVSLIYGVILEMKENIIKHNSKIKEVE